MDLRPNALAHSAKFRILVAEDNVINQKVISAMLRQEGFAAHVVSDGAQAIAAHRAYPYDLILMDVQMPGVDGFEAARRIRRLPEPQPVIVAVTASVLDRIRERCLEAGMDDYISKPFTRDHLMHSEKGS
jgi:two-component system, sensor histidine kinase